MWSCQKTVAAHHAEIKQEKAIDLKENKDFKEAEKKAENYLKEIEAQIKALQTKEKDDLKAVEKTKIRRKKMWKKKRM